MKLTLKVWCGVIGAFMMLVAFGPGCGGGGTGTGSATGSATGGNIVKYSVEATKNGSIIDPTNISMGETVQFVVAGYTATNARSIQSSSGWVANPPGDTEGTMNSNGQFVSTATAGLFTVSATAGGSLRSGPAQVRTPGAFVTGHLVNGFGDPVPGAVVDFYDSTNSKVGDSTSQFDGSFRAVVPTTAVTFEVRKTAIPSGYYKEYFFNAKWYLPAGACRAPLPVLTNGGTKALANITIPPTTFNGASLAPPPPPSACS